MIESLQGLATQTGMSPAVDSVPEMAEQGDAFKDTIERLEQMLWTEMLSHAGLEKAFTLGGGEDAAAFSRYLVEAIAEDLAAQHDFNFADSPSLGSLDSYAALQEKI
ncbi:MAG: hypothetical protein AAFO63_04645 [Pseudomonadota bacterium]